MTDDDKWVKVLPTYIYTYVHERPTLLRSSKCKLLWAELLSIMLAKTNSGLRDGLLSPLQPVTSPRNRPSALVGEWLNAYRYGFRP